MNATDLGTPFIIVDVGSNWKRGATREAQLAMAKRHIFDAALCGADAVKFQLFTDKELYGLEGGSDEFALPREWVPELAAFAAQCDVEFMCSAFSVDGLKYVDNFVNVHKLASAEMKHPEMLRALISFGKPFIISTGGAHFDELDWLMDFLWKNYADMNNVVLLECVPEYPAPLHQYNLESLKRKYKLSRTEKKSDGVVTLATCEIRPIIGVSDHTMTDNGCEVALVGVGLGATVFELHFDALGHVSFATKYRTPDTDVSADAPGLQHYVQTVRTAMDALGDGEKRGGMQSGFTLRHRRRLKVIAPIKTGEKLEYGVNYGIYRSLTSDSTAAAPEHYEKFNGAIAKVDMNPGDPVWFDRVEQGQ